MGSSPFWISCLPLFVWIFCLSFLSILFNASLNVRMLECNTEIPYLDEPVKLVFKLHFSTYRTWQTFSGPCRDLVNYQSWRRHCPSPTLYKSCKKFTWWIYALSERLLVWFDLIKFGHVWWQHRWRVSIWCRLSMFSRLDVPRVRARCKICKSR